MHTLRAESRGLGCLVYRRKELLGIGALTLAQGLRILSSSHEDSGVGGLAK